jgi:hypothetical protein
MAVAVRVSEVLQRDRTLDHPKLEFCALLTMAGWLRHRGMQQDRRLVADCPVGPFFVVVSAHREQGIAAGIGESGLRAGAALPSR